MIHRFATRKETTTMREKLCKFLRPRLAVLLAALLLAAYLPAMPAA